MSSGKSWPQRGIAAVLLVMCADLALFHARESARIPRDTFASGRLKPDTPSPKPDATSSEQDAGSSASVQGDRKVECERRAAQMAVWRGRTTSGQVQEPAWLGHYSDRDDVCYALMAGKATLANGEPPPLVTELWNALDGTLLATSTTDRRADMRRDFCRIDLAEDPFTSCLVADFFIRQHLAR